MLDFTYYSPTKIVFGKDKELEVGQIVKSYNWNNVLIVIGSSSVKKSGLLDKVLNKLKEEQVNYQLLEGVQPNPVIDLVRIGISMIKQNPVDGILAIGGGSVIDTAKCIAAGYYLNDDPWKLNAGLVKCTKALPIGVILTIAAAGSELSDSCVISNPETMIKNGFNSNLIRPVFSIMNPELTYSVSKYQTACGIVDIIMHTIERYLCEVNDNYFEEEMALGVIKSVIKAGKIAYQNPTDYDARGALLVASSFSHNGLTGIGGKMYFTVHKLEHQLSGIKPEVAHGAGLAVLFPAWAYNVYQLIPNKFADFARTCMNIDEQDDLLAAKLGIDALKDFFKSLDMPTSLSDFNITKDDIEYMSNRITQNGTTTVSSFNKLTKEDVLKIYNDAF